MATKPTGRPGSAWVVRADVAIAAACADRRPKSIWLMYSPAEGAVTRRSVAWSGIVAWRVR